MISALLISFLGCQGFVVCGQEVRLDCAMRLHLCKQETAHCRNPAQPIQSMYARAAGAVCNVGNVLGSYLLVTIHTVNTFQCTSTIQPPV